MPTHLLRLVGLVPIQELPPQPLTQEAGCLRILPSPKAYQGGEEQAHGWQDFAKWPSHLPAPLSGTI